MVLFSRFCKLITLVKGLVPLFLILFSIPAIADNSPEGRLVSFEDSSTVSLIHIVRSEYVDQWQNLVLPRLLAEKDLPEELFRTGKFGGVFVNVVPRVDSLTELTREEILKNSFFKNYTGAWESLMEDSIMIVLNPKAGARWLSGDVKEKQYQRLNWQWYLNPLNLLKKNKFEGEFLDIIKKNWRMPFRHSRIYEENGIIGHAHHLSARSEGPRMLTAVVTNSQQLEAIRVIIPAHVSLTGHAIDFLTTRSQEEQLRSGSKEFQDAHRSVLCHKISN